MNADSSIKILKLKSIDSTNNFLKSYQPEQEDAITLVTADYQTAGRGQRGNSWESEEGKNLVYSLLIHPRMVRPAQIFSISEVAALSVCEALDDILSSNQESTSTDGNAFCVKWPNDIYYGDRKIAGILIETDMMGKRIENAIIGVGVNINQHKFLSDAPNPVSLYQITHQEVEREEVLESIVTHFKSLYTLLEQGEFEGLHTRFKNRLYRKEGYHPYSDENGQFDARISDIEPTGHIILQDRSGLLRRYAFKEVSFLIKGEL